MFATGVNLVQKLIWLDDQAFVSLSHTQLRVWDSSTPEAVLDDVRRLEADGYFADKLPEAASAASR